MFLIIKYKAKSWINKISNLKGWRLFKTIIFTSTSIFLLIILYLSFVRVIKYLNGIELIGELLIWKLTAMVFVISFSMIVVSSLIISMTTLFYSYDLKFLFSLPIKEENIFTEKMIATVFYSSWSLMVIILPYIFAVVKVKKLGFDFIASFLILSLPYAFLASIVGIIFSLVLMYLFPNSKTRDIIWIISSLSFALLYVALRFSKPEKLLRPDMLGVIANYLSYLQTPTAPYLPSWWFTKALISISNSNYKTFIIYSFLLFITSLILYFLLKILSRKTYFYAFSGAQSSNQKIYKSKDGIFFNIFKKIFNSEIYVILFKEKLNLLRDVRYISQIILIIALSSVYIFSIKSLPLDNYEAKNFVSFLNIIVSGFVVSAISLRFVFTSISSEGKEWWIIKSSPVSMKNFLLSKLFFYYIPMLIFSLTLVVISNYYLEVDKFMFRLSTFISVIMSFVISTLAIGFGAIFPDFRIENIHQVESSYGGFLFMAFSFFYCVFTGIIFSTPVKSYFLSIYNPNYSFEKETLYLAIIIFIVISFLTSYFIFKKGIKNLENFEE